MHNVKVGPAKSAAGRSLQVEVGAGGVIRVSCDHGQVEGSVRKGPCQACAEIVADAIATLVGSRN